MSGFDRWKPWTSHSWAFRIFIKHNTELNQYYWSHVPARNFAQKFLRKNKNRFVSTFDLFSFKGADAHRLAQKCDDWNKNYREFDNWVRLSSLMSASAYFEIYIRSITTTALESNPGLIIKSKNQIDGVEQLKSYGKLHSYWEATKDCVEGDWSKRIKKYESLFKDVPTTLKTNISHLEKVRKMRNGFGHAFGRETTDYKQYNNMQTLPINRLSEEHLKCLLKIIGDCATAVDEHLLSEIGCFELIRSYHLFSNKFRRTVSNTAFRKLIGKNFGRALGKKYFSDMIKYYDSI